MNTRSSLCVLLLPVLLATGGCSDVSWPWTRQHDAAAVTQPALDSADGGDNDAECAHLRTELKDNEQRVHDAPADSTSPEIVRAEQAKAGQQIDSLRARYEALECPGEADPRYRQAPVVPAPGALPP